MKRAMGFVFAIAFLGVGFRAERPAALQKIFSNLGASPNTYFSGGGLTVSGPNSAGGYTHFVAMPFTPTANAHVRQVRVAVQYAGSGANQVNLSLYGDSNRAPGSLLAGPVTVTSLPNTFTCCNVAVGTFAAATPVNAGIRYWVVADTPATGTGSDFSGTWDFLGPTKLLVGVNDNGAGWSSYLAITQEPAGAVYGTIP